MNTAALKRFAQQARIILKEGVQARLRYWGFDEKGNLTEEPVQVDGGIIFRGEGIDDPRLYKRWTALKRAVSVHGVQHVAEEAAYTWFNRLMAIRILAKNGYIPPQLEFESDLMQVPLIVSNARRGHYPPLDADEQKRLHELLRDDSAETQQFALLITAFCRTNKLLRNVFGRMDDYTELLLPTNILAGNGFIRLLNHNGFISADDYKQVELIGWLYQFYISEKKDEVFKSFKNKKKAEAEDIPAATQIFTPNWIVKYMVENTVGRIWLDLNPDSAIKEGMTYLVENPDAVASDPLISEVADIKLLDPACGSGHILVEGFDLLFAMYTEEGYSKREAVREILRRNLYGLDIDLRAAQLANFALLLKAAAKDPAILEEDIQPQVYAMPDAYTFSDDTVLTFLGTEKQYADSLQELLKLMRRARNLGSIMKIEISPEMREYLHNQLSYWTKRLDTINNFFVREEFDHLFPYVRIILLLTQQYEAVAANPPYMGSGNMNGELKEYVNKNYPKSKADLFAVFMETGMFLCADNGRMGMINMHSWMFLSSFEALRKEVIENSFIENMLHLGARTFDELSGEVVQNTAFVLRNTNHIGYGVYYRLVDGRNCGEKEQLFLQGKGRFSHISQSNFEKIPGSPIAYWASEQILSIISSFKNLDIIADIRSGISTGDNDKYYRLWFEPSSKKIELNSNPSIVAQEKLVSKKKWFKIIKGGENRRWYGNQESIIDLENDCYRIKNSKKNFRLRTPSFYFKEGVTWSRISSEKVSFRKKTQSVTFGENSPCLFSDNMKQGNYILAFLNTKITPYLLSFINPTLSFQVVDIARLPIKESEDVNIDSIIKECVSISRLDWDSRETSWDFQENELIKQQKSTIEEAYKAYFQFWTEQFRQLHRNEIELNRIFIDIYGLQDELTPEVKLKDITILQEEVDYKALGELTEMEELPDPSCLPIKADEVMRQFISYAIGCMMGRYRLDRPGLHIAHPNPSEEEIASYTYKGEVFRIDEDAIIPLMDASCGFVDNALLRLKDFVCHVWGRDAEIENINFMESTLGKELETYLVKDFWKDHVRRYQKRPIYWLFTSPKGAFQVLVYMHRMNKYTVEKIRSNYLLKHIQNLESRLELLENNSANLDRNEQRELDKIIKDLDECRAYDLLLKNVADHQIEFDLDDGVVVNYAKFDGVVGKIK